MGEIYISPCNHLPLDEMLLVPLVFVYRIEKAGVEPRLSASLRLTVLRSLSRALAQCLRRTPISPRRHETLQRATPMSKHYKEPVTRAGREDKPPVTRYEGGPLPNLTP